MNTTLTAGQHLEEANKKLNIAYQRILKGMPADEDDQHPKTSLIAAQRAWIKFRDAECASVGESTGGARIWKNAYDVICQVDMTEARTKNLVKQFSP